MIITLKDIIKTYKMGDIGVQALKGINLDIAEGEFVSIAGPSGSGKSTLLNIIGLVDNFNSGSLTFCDKEIKPENGKNAPNSEDLALLRREFLGFVFQSFNLLPVLNVFENIELPLVISKKGGNKAERRERVQYLLEEVGLKDRRNHVPSELSGGEQQRVAIARALVTKPKIVLADEPTANLDSKNGELVLSLMKEINKNEKTTFIFSTHDSKIWEMADRVVFLKDGLINAEKRKEHE